MGRNFERSGASLVAAVLAACASGPQPVPVPNNFEPNPAVAVQTRRQLTCSAANTVVSNIFELTAADAFNMTDQTADEALKAALCKEKYSSASVDEIISTVSDMKAVCAAAEADSSSSPYARENAKFFTDVMASHEEIIAVSLATIGRICTRIERDQYTNTP